MAKSMMIGNANGIAKKVIQPYIGNANGVAKKVKAAWIGDANGIAKQFYSSETLVGDLSIGSSVYMTFNNTRTEFIVVHQGIPSNEYDSSCNGTWLLMKDLYTTLRWDSYTNNYANSNIHAYLKGTVLGSFNSEIQSIIKQVKIPYHNGTGANGSYNYGTNGLSTKIFLLSCYEVGITSGGYMTQQGSCLGYFNGLPSSYHSKRIAYLNGTASRWWTRTPDSISNNGVNGVNEIGGLSNYSVDGTYSVYGVRPALILPSDTLIDESFNIVA